MSKSVHVSEKVAEALKRYSRDNGVTMIVAADRLLAGLGTSPPKAAAAGGFDENTLGRLQYFMDKRKFTQAQALKWCVLRAFTRYYSQFRHDQSLKDIVVPVHPLEERESRGDQ
jgi:hypothetical protein